MASLLEKFCIVCGIGSHRLDWQDKAQPACDSHSAAEIQAAIAAKAAKGPQLVPPAATPTPTGGTPIPPKTA